MNRSGSMMKDLTKGSVARLLLLFALPLLFSNALQAVYNLVDMIVVGQFIGSAGMSAVSIGGDLLHLLTFVAVGFSSAGQVLIARDIGAGRRERVQKTIGTMFSFLLGVALFVTVLCCLLRHPILRALNTPGESYAYTMDYLVTCAAGMFFIYGYNIVSAILRGMGDSKRPFVFITIAVVLNLALDLLFVCVFGMAVFGAALATVIGQGVSFVTALVYLYRRRESFGFDFRPASFVPERRALTRLVALGVPMALQSAAVSLSKVVLMSWINAAGVVYSALAGVYNKVSTMCSIVSNSFTTAGSTMVGQNLGARRTDRVAQTLWIVAGVGLFIGALFSVTLLWFSREVFALFTSDAAVLSAASILVLPSILNFGGAATRSVAFSLINGSANTRLNLAVAILDGLVARIGIAAFLGFACGMGCQGFWYGDALAGFMPITIGLCYLVSGRWKRSVTQ